MKEAATLQFERAIGEYAVWLAVPEEDRSPAPAWWWSWASRPRPGPAGLGATDGIAGRVHDRCGRAADVGGVYGPDLSALAGRIPAPL